MSISLRSSFLVALKRLQSASIVTPCLAVELVTFVSEVDSDSPPDHLWPVCFFLFLFLLFPSSDLYCPRAFQWRGRPGKEFLYQIVANKTTGIDVDKFDYFARDAHALGMVRTTFAFPFLRTSNIYYPVRCCSSLLPRLQAISFDAHRLMKFARVLRFEGEPQICFHEKEAWNIYELFHTRYNLHKRAYQHRVACAGEMMMVSCECRW